jgi:hypothetical protein
MKQQQFQVQTILFVMPVYAVRVKNDLAMSWAAWVQQNGSLAQNHIHLPLLSYSPLLLQPSWSSHNSFIMETPHGKLTAYRCIRTESEIHLYV